MQRSSRLSLNLSNEGKLESLESLLEEGAKVINLFIKDLWEEKNFSSKFVKTKVSTWLSARMQQALGKQALEIVKSQRKKKRKSMPEFTSRVLNLDSRFIDFEFDKNSFDFWVRLSSLGKKLQLKLPARKHIQFNKFYKSWTLKKSVRIGKDLTGNYYLEVFFEKTEPLKILKGRAKAVDIGYKKLIVSSSGEYLGDSKIYEKISRKKQGSKAFDRALQERDEEINRACKSLNLVQVKTLIVEDLKNVKRNSRGKIRKQFNNKLQRWSYSKVLNKLSLICEESGVTFKKVNPAYTSQRCSKCGAIHKESRKSEVYSCIVCGKTLDADFNASLNILHLGEYGPQAFKQSS